MSPKLFDEWLVMHSIEPWGDDWLQASAAACAIINEIRRQLNKDVQDSDLLPLDKLIPSTGTDKPEAITLTQSLSFMRAQAGV